MVFMIFILLRVYFFMLHMKYAKCENEEWNDSYFRMFPLLASSFTLQKNFLSQNNFSWYQKSSKYIRFQTIDNSKFGKIYIPWKIEKFCLGIEKA